MNKLITFSNIKNQQFTSQKEQIYAKTVQKFYAHFYT